MNRTRLLLLLALCAAGAFVWSMRATRVAGATAHVADAVDAATPDAAAASGLASDSPNAAERLQAAGLAGVRGSAELSSAPSAEARQPGLPEFFRGA